MVRYKFHLYYCKSEVNYKGKLEINLSKIIPESDSTVYQPLVSDRFFLKLGTDLILILFKYHGFLAWQQTKQKKNKNQNPTTNQKKNLNLNSHTTIMQWYYPYLWLPKLIVCAAFYIDFKLGTSWLWSVSLN